MLGSFCSRDHSQCLGPQKGAGNALVLAADFLLAFVGVAADAAARVARRVRQVVQADRGRVRRVEADGLQKQQVTVRSGSAQMKTRHAARVAIKEAARSSRTSPHC